MGAMAGEAFPLNSRFMLHPFLKILAFMAIETIYIFRTHFLVVLVTI